jgi:prepilin-type processing-associated H-X9-DG protein
MVTYTFIGSDQKPYSSVVADDIRRWIAEGRLNGQSLMKSEGDAEFRPLSTFAEFAAALAAGTAQETTPSSSSFSAGTATQAKAKTSGLATASLLLGFLGLLVIPALVGLILGIIALVKIKQSRGTLGGGVIALAGIIVSVFFLSLFIIFGMRVGVPHAYRVNCMANIMMLNKAMRTYAENNKNQFPTATNWCDVLLKSHASLTNIFHCPANSSRSRCSYAFNAQLSGADTGKVNPKTVMIFESNGGWNASGGKELLLAKPRHGDFINVGFADGHGEAVTESELKLLRWNP